ncbi:MAG: hypothetical protein WBA51_00885 [Erythrobacter sp.]
MLENGAEVSTATQGSGRSRSILPTLISPHEDFRALRAVELFKS